MEDSHVPWDGNDDPNPAWSARSCRYGAALGFVLMIVTLFGTLVALRTLRREVVGAD